MVQLNDPLVNEALVEAGVAAALLDAFAAYPWNNRLHTAVVDFVCSATVYQDPGSPLRAHVLSSDCNIRQRVLDMVAANAAAPIRLGYMGHVTQLANLVEFECGTAGGSAQGVDGIEQSGADTPGAPQLPAPRPDGWDAFVSGELADINRINATEIYGPGSAPPSGTHMAYPPSPQLDNVPLPPVGYSADSPRVARSNSILWEAVGDNNSDEWVDDPEDADSDGSASESSSGPPPPRRTPDSPRVVSFAGVVLADLAEDDRNGEDGGEDGGEVTDVIPGAALPSLVLDTSVGVSTSIPTTYTPEARERPFWEDFVPDETGESSIGAALFVSPALTGEDDTVVTSDDSLWEESGSGADATAPSLPTPPPESGSGGEDGSAGGDGGREADAEAGDGGASAELADQE